MIMEKEDYVSIEVAKLLKERGFDKPVFSQYTNVGSVWRCDEPENFNESIDCYSRPTLYEAQKWLRTKYNIHIVIDNCACGYGWFLYKADNGTRIEDYEECGPNDGGCWDNYEEALSAGILESLKLI